MDWFKFHHGAVNDPKVQKLSPTMFKHWVNVLCLASANTPRGRVPAPGDVAFALRIAEGRAQTLLDDLMALGLLDEDGEGNLVPHNWKGRQYDDGHDPEERSEAGIRGNHVKWHVKGKKPNANCSLCIAEGIAPATRLATLANRDTEQNRTETDPEQRRAEATAVVVPVIRAFEQCFGRLLSPMEIENIKALDEEHPREVIDYALREASDHNARNIRYVQRVCENQGREPRETVMAGRKSDLYDE